MNLHKEYLGTYSGVGAYMGDYGIYIPFVSSVSYLVSPMFVCDDLGFSLTAVEYWLPLC